MTYTSPDPAVQRQAARFARDRVFYHGHSEDIPDTHLRSPQERGSFRGNYGASQRDRVYATPSEDLAWSYAEHTAAIGWNRAPKALQPSNAANRKTAWSADPTTVDRRAPRVSSVDLEGDIDVDHNWYKHELPIEQQKAFTGSRARIMGTESIPVGAQTSMLPHPVHGGRYTRDLDGESADNNALAGAMAQLENRNRRPRAVHTDDRQTALFPDSVGRDRTTDDIARILGV